MFKIGFSKNLYFIKKILISAEVLVSNVNFKAFWYTKFIFFDKKNKAENISII